MALPGESLIYIYLLFIYNFFHQTAGKVSIDPDALDKLQVRKADFDFALENDIKPSFGANIEDFESYVGNGMLNFSNSFTLLLDFWQVLDRKLTFYIYFS